MCTKHKINKNKHEKLIKLREIKLSKKIKEKKEGFYITLANIDNSRYSKKST